MGRDTRITNPAIMLLQEIKIGAHQISARVNHGPATLDGPIHEVILNVLGLRLVEASEAPPVTVLAHEEDAHVHVELGAPTRRVL